MGFIKFAKNGNRIFDDNLQKLKEYHGGYDYKNFWQNGIEPFEIGKFFFVGTLKTVRKAITEEVQTIHWFMKYVINNRFINFNV